ncbi:hypothetical protein BDV97DRAFT_372424 [Delphinella strobiligena]|nr:hypothetical protein BDV97DRAFT_372424 [Delphinella strobiligena]
MHETPGPKCPPSLPNLPSPPNKSLKLTHPTQSHSRRSAEWDSLRHAYWGKNSRLRELRTKHIHLIHQVTDTLKGRSVEIFDDFGYTQTRLRSSLTTRELRHMCDDMDVQIARLVARQEDMIERTIRVLRERQGVLGLVTVEHNPSPSSRHDEGNDRDQTTGSKYSIRHRSRPTSSSRPTNCQTVPKVIRTREIVPDKDMVVPSQRERDQQVGYVDHAHALLYYLSDNPQDRLERAGFENSFQARKEDTIVSLTTPFYNGLNTLAAEFLPECI